MTLTVRLATPIDLDAALGLEQAASAAKAEALRKAFAGEHGRTAYIAELDGQPAGYAVMGEFFGHPFLERLLTADHSLRQGVATALMETVEEAARGGRLFVSTNESNTIMRTLLAKRDFKVSGLVENLDPGDPELFFVKFAPEANPA
jgi:GNAT superfamily N-acetyltransferase